MEQIFKDVTLEIDRQDILWGKQNHAGFKWMALLMEEVGEVAEAILSKDIHRAREELVQVAALAMQTIEAIDRDLERPTNDSHTD